jgi:hypothetical protein
MANRYWVHEKQMLKAVGVPGEAVAFAIGAPCPCAGGFICEIRREPQAYACTTSDFRVRNRHVGWPRLTVEVDGTELVVTDNELDKISRFTGVPQKAVP